MMRRKIGGLRESFRLKDGGKGEDATTTDKSTLRPLSSRQFTECQLQSALPPLPTKTAILKLSRRSLRNTSILNESVSVEQLNHAKGDDLLVEVLAQVLTQTKDLGITEQQARELAGKEVFKAAFYRQFRVMAGRDWAKNRANLGDDEKEHMGRYLAERLRKEGARRQQVRTCKFQSLLEQKLEELKRRAQIKD